MFEPILSGIGFGLIICVMIGPVFFALLQTSLHEGFRAGVHLATGVLLSDAFWIAVTYFFAAQLDLTGTYRVYTGWIGGLLLMIFGLSMLFSKMKVKDVDDNKRTVHAKFVLKGFLLNTFNPAIPLFWLGIISVMKLKDNYSTIHEAFFFGSVLTTVFATDIFKAFIAHRLKQILKPLVLLWINRSVGIILMLIGLRMIIKVYS
ncbi:MAG: LysE family translocator [Bacteroidetes bacterium]|nr:LysE family translocator [Bacteroidota bacterium]